MLVCKSAANLQMESIYHSLERSAPGYSSRTKEQRHHKHGYTTNGLGAFHPNPLPPPVISLACHVLTPSRCGPSFNSSWWKRITVISAHSKIGKQKDCAPPWISHIDIASTISSWYSCESGDWFSNRTKKFAIFPNCNVDFLAGWLIDRTSVLRPMMLRKFSLSAQHPEWEQIQYK